MGKSKLDQFEEYNLKDSIPNKKPKPNWKGQEKSITINCPFGSIGQLEKDVIKECKPWLYSIGCSPVKIYTGGIIIDNAMVANEAEGMPDYIVFQHNKKRKFWIEFKRNTGGKISQAQSNWHSWLRNAGDIVIIACSIKHLQNELDKAYLNEI